MKIQEFRGVRGLVAAEVLEDSAENFTTGTPFPIAGVSEISRTTDSNSDTHYYDNAGAIAVQNSAASVLTINTSAIELDVLAKITGNYYDSNLGMYVEQERTPKQYALGYVTKKIGDGGGEVFVWRLKGTFGVPDETLTTENDGTDANGQELTYTSLRTIHKFAANGNKTADSVTVDTTVNEQDEAEFFAKVQTPDDVKKN